MTTTLLIAGIVVFTGAVVQGTIGFGLNIIAGPILTMLDPMLVPAPVLMVAMGLGVLLALRERGSIDWSGVGWAMVGRVPGNFLGVLALSVLPLVGFTLVIGLTVLACVALSLITWKPRLSRGSLVIAGTASGAFGTAASIGGPPIALLYQRESGPTIRATLAVFFLLGSFSSLITLGVAGHLRTEHLTAAAILLPFMALGAAVSNPLRRFLHGGRLRVGVLIVAGASAILLIGQSLLT